MKFFLAFFVIIFPFGVIASSPDFSRTLKQGMRGDDVRELQKILNTNNETRIAEYGAGSPGSETRYFGLGTKRALIKFQEKYASEILMPSGFSVGTGVFGQRTREKMLTLLKSVTPTVSVAFQTPVITATTTLINQDMFPLLDRKDFNVDMHGIQTEGEFFQTFGKISTQIGFTDTELSVMKKVKIENPQNENAKERVATLEELIDYAKKGDLSDGVKKSFIAWGNLLGSTATTLKATSVTYSVFPANQELASWFTYQASIAARFGAGDLAQDSINSLSQEYSIKAKKHTALYGENLARAMQATGTTFLFTKKAEATICAGINFGGRVGPYLPCNFGTVNSIIGVCGGLVLFTWPVQGANPFMFHNIYTPGVAVLGRSAPVPGICPLGCGVPPCGISWPYTDVAIFYGTAVVPGI